MKWATFDPGESAGWSIWEDDKLVDAGTTPMWDLADILTAAYFFPDQDWSEWEFADEVEVFKGCERFVVEDFRLYPWLLRDGSMDWNAVRTARLIGVITQVARWNRLELVLQPAKIKETAVAAGAEEYFMSPRHDNRHANDAIMHGCYYLAIQAGAKPVPMEETGE